MRKAIVLVAVLALFAGWRTWSDARATRPLNRVATALAGRSVSVHCPGFFARLVDIHGESGSVMFDANGRPSDTTDLRDWVCGDLEHFRSRNGKLGCVDTGAPCDTGAERTVEALVTLAHESAHLKGVAGEAEAQCAAVQTVAETARMLGAEPARADAIARYFLAHDQPLMPSDYALPSGCADGGSLDLAPSQPGWPNPPSA